MSIIANWLLRRRIRKLRREIEEIRARQDAFLNAVAHAHAARGIADIEAYLDVHAVWGLA